MARYGLRVGLDVLKMAREGRVSCVAYRESNTGILEGDALLLWSRRWSALGIPDADRLEVTVTGVRACPDALLPGWVLVDFEVPSMTSEYENADREE